MLPGQSGVMVDNPGGLAAAIDEARRLDPWICGKHVQQNFTTDLMAAGYEAVYLRALAAPAGPAMVAAPGRRGAVSTITASTVASGREPEGRDADGRSPRWPSGAAAPRCAAPRGIRLKAG